MGCVVYEAGWQKDSRGGTTLPYIQAGSVVPTLSPALTSLPSPAPRPALRGMVTEDRALPPSRGADGLFGGLQIRAEKPRLDRLSGNS